MSSRVPGTRSGGRFDPTTADPFEYLYCADTRKGALVAIHETVLRDKLFSEDEGAFVVTKKEVESRALAYFRPLRDLTLADLTSAVGLAKFGATTDLIYSRSYTQTRKWARYIRRCAPDVDGLAWTSRQAGDGWAAIVFGDRGVSSDSFEVNGPPLRLMSEGRPILDAVLSECEAVLDDP